GLTPLAGLYAAGECANVGLNGGNRLGSDSLSGCMGLGAGAGGAAGEECGPVPGGRAAECARSPKRAGSNPITSMLADETRRIEMDYLNKKSGDQKIGVIREEMQRDMDAGAGVLRTVEGLEKLTKQRGALRDRFERIKIEDSSRTFNTELMAALELDYMLEVADSIAYSALAREESRGAHARRDFPERDDAQFLKHTIAFRTDELAPRLDYRDVRITNFKPQA